MNVLVVGGSGLVGGNIYYYLTSITDWKITGTYNNYNVATFVHFDATDQSTWLPVIWETNWDVIIHTGALTNVDQCENDPELSERFTVKTTVNLCYLAIKHKSKLIYISTDYVFDGKNGPYSEEATPNPLCVYGKHKLISEEYIKNNISDYLILRVTNVYGDEIRGKNFLSRTIDLIKVGENLTISAPCDQFATPVNAFDIAKAIYLLIVDKKKGIYHISSTDFLNRVQFLNKINSYFGDKLTINPVETLHFNQAAKRPLVGGLIAVKFMGEYPKFFFSNIDDYLKKHNEKL